MTRRCSDKTCPYCINNKTYNSKRRAIVAAEKIKEYNS